MSRESNVAIVYDPVKYIKWNEVFATAEPGGVSRFRADLLVHS
jgi:hypothetical protein